jgi:hypothetical protein
MRIPNVFTLSLYKKMVKLSKFYLPNDAQKSCFKRILKFTLKQILHVSVQSPSPAKVIVIKIHRCGLFGGLAAATPPNQPQ